MKKTIYLSIILLFSSCSDLTELNVDNKNPEVVPASNLLANALVTYFDYMATTNVNRNTFRLWAQQWAQVSYSEESNYELIERGINESIFDRFYASVNAGSPNAPNTGNTGSILNDLNAARGFINSNTVILEEHKKNQLAIIDIVEVMAYVTLVDIFGNVPCSEALNPDNVTPKYDDDKEIYYEMFNKLNGAISALSGSAGDAGDVIYGGDASAWKKLANSFKLKMAIRIADVDFTKASSEAEAAIASGIFESNDDNFTIQYEMSTPNTNPLWEDLVESNRSDYVACQTIVDYMNSLNDPRRSQYFKPNVTNDMGEVVYVGGVAGAVNSFVDNSQIGSKLHDPTFPFSILSYTEVLFLLADASERGMSVAKSASEYYNEAITNSILEWGGSQEEVDAYLKIPLVDYDQAQGTWKGKIGLQKYIALYNNGIEAYSSYRFYDAPALNLADVAGTLPPTRWSYPVNEKSVNGDNYESAIGAMNANNNKIFWDIH